MNLDFHVDIILPRQEI